MGEWPWQEQRHTRECRQFYEDYGNTVAACEVEGHSSLGWHYGKLTWKQCVGVCVWGVLGCVGCWGVGGCVRFTGVST